MTLRIHDDGRLSRDIDFRQTILYTITTMTPTQRILPESSVIAPRDPSTDNNTDDWPVFDLHDVTVVDPNGEPASLLHASAYYPLTVRGRLRPLSKDVSHLYLRHQGQPSLGIEITDVRMFSYGAYKNGSIGLWASGKAGWFQISPSAAYRRTYDEMTEAVNLLYFVADSFAIPRTGKKGSNVVELNTQGLFERYSAKKIGNKATAAEAAEKFYEHREFLLGSMMSGKEGMSWGANPFYKHLKNKFPGDWENVRRRLFEPAQTPAGTASRPRRESVDSASTSSSLKRKRGRPAKSQAADVISIASSVASSSAAKTAPAESQAVSNSQPTTSRTKLASRSTRSQGTSIPDVPGTPELQKTSRTGAEDEDSEDTDSLPRPSKAKSALRLKPNKPIKGPRRSVRPPSPEAEDDDAVDDSDNPTTSAQAAVDSHHKSHDLDEGISMPTSPSSSASAGALQHIPDPLYEDTWRCALVGCTHRVYAASHPDSQALIKQHYALHASDDDERVKLVQALAAPSLPAGRLIERVRLQARNDLGGMEGTRVGGSRFPTMINRRL